MYGSFVMVTPRGGFRNRSWAAGPPDTARPDRSAAAADRAFVVHRGDTLPASSGVRPAPV